MDLTEFNSNKAVVGVGEGIDSFSRLFEEACAMGTALSRKKEIIHEMSDMNVPSYKLAKVACHKNNLCDDGVMSCVIETLYKKGVGCDDKGNVLTGFAFLYEHGLSRLDGDNLRERADEMAGALVRLADVGVLSILDDYKEFYTDEELDHWLGMLNEPVIDVSNVADVPNARRLPEPSNY